MRRIIAVFILIALMFGVCSVYAHAQTIISDASATLDYQFIESNSVEVTIENLSSIVSDCAVPEEVVEALRERLARADSGEVVTLFVPTTLSAESSIQSRTTTSNWSPIRNYQGYQLTDWVITISNSHDMTPIQLGTAQNNIWSFVGSIVAFAGSTLLDTMDVFGGPLITAAEYLLGLESNSVYPGEGDKISAAPQYTCYETFTYVVVDGQYYLGAHTYAAYVRQITWFAYYAAEDRQETKVTGASKTYKSENYNNVNNVAVQWYSLGGWNDEPVYIKIGNTRFMLN